MAVSSPSFSTLIPNVHHILKSSAASCGYLSQKGQMALLYFFIEEAESIWHKHMSPLKPTCTFIASAPDLKPFTAVMEGGLTLHFTHINHFQAVYFFMLVHSVNQQTATCSLAPKYFRHCLLNFFLIDSHLHSLYCSKFLTSLPCHYIIFRKSFLKSHTFSVLSQWKSSFIMI